MDPYAQIEQYARELDIDTQVDVTNVMEKQMSAPNVRHKWLYRLTQAKQGLLQLVTQKEALLEQKMQGNPLPVSAPVLKRKAESDADIRKLNLAIQQQELLVGHLNDAVKQIQQMSFDFKNLVELMKMENL